MKKITIKNTLIAAGFDPSGGAGMVRDLRTMRDSGVIATGIVTAITAQNEKRFLGWIPVDSDMVRMQLKSILEENPVKWVKIGMVGTVENLNCLLDDLRNTQTRPFVLLDPVLRTSTGSELAETDMVTTILARIENISVLTPNIPELEQLTQTGIDTAEQAVAAAKRLIEKGLRAVVVKGGHLPGPPTDMLITGSDARIFEGKRLHGTVHGTGCAFSSAMTARLASKGIDMPDFDDLADALKYAKAYVAGLFTEG